MKAVALVGIVGLTLVPEAPAFEVEGVCAIDEKAVSCWSPTGNPLPELTAEVDRQVRTGPYPLGFVPGRKNRFVVVHSARLAWYTVVGERVQFYSFPNTKEPARMLARVAVLPSAREASLSLNSGVYRADPVEMPLRKGAKATVDGIRVEVGPIAINPGYREVFSGFAGRWIPGMGSRWRIAIDRTSADDSNTVAFEPLGHDGQAIHYVDEQGRPVSDAKVQAARPDPSKPMDWSRLPRYSNATFGGDGFSPQPVTSEALWLYTNVDPKYVRRLRIRHVVPQTQTLGPFPLDPQPSVP